MLSRFLWHHLWSSWHDENPVIMYFPKHSMPGPDVCLHTAAVTVSTETLKKVTIRQRWRGTGTGSAAHPVPGLMKASPFILVLAVCTRAGVWVCVSVGVWGGRRSDLLESEVLSKPPLMGVQNWTQILCKRSMPLTTKPSPPVPKINYRLIKSCKK